MTPDKLDTVIKVSFAAMILGVGYSQFVPESSSAVALLIWLAGMAGVAVAGFWRARLIRNDERPRAPVSASAARVVLPATSEVLRSERLRDVGLISFLLGLFLLLVAFFVLFVSRPDPNIAIAGGILTTLGALALAKRYRFFGVLVAFFVVPIGLIGAVVIWPPTFFVLLAIALAWAVARLWGRAHPRPSA